GDTPATARSDPRAVDRPRPSCRARLHPEPAEGTVHDLPLLALRRELSPAFASDSVVLALAAAFGRGPLRGDETLALEAVQNRIEHAVGPLEVPARQLGHSLDDGVAIAVAF